MFQVLYTHYLASKEIKYLKTKKGSFNMMKTLSLHMQTNNRASTNMGIVYVVPVQNKAGIHIRPRTAMSS